MFPMVLWYVPSLFGTVIYIYFDKLQLDMHLNDKIHYLVSVATINRPFDIQLGLCLSQVLDAGFRFK